MTLAMSELDAAAAAEIFVLAAMLRHPAGRRVAERPRALDHATRCRSLTLAGAALVTVAYGVDGARVRRSAACYVADPMGDVLKLFSYGTVAVAFLYSREYLQRRGLFKGEYFILGLVALLGIMVMISARQPPHGLSRASSCCRCRCTPWSRSIATRGSPPSRR